MPAVLDLFENTFHHSMTPATWQWKYGHHSGYQIGVWRDDQLIAHYGGCGRRILFFGQPQHAVQIADVMVNSNDRGILTKTGPFFLMAATFPERFVGYGKPFLVGFGFPNERAMKVAERHGLYAEVGCMTEFCWPSLPKLPLKPAARCISLTIMPMPPAPHKPPCSPSGKNLAKRVALTQRLPTCTSPDCSV